MLVANTAGAAALPMVVVGTEAVAQASARAARAHISAEHCCRAPRPAAPAGRSERASDSGQRVLVTGAPRNRGVAMPPPSRLPFARGLRPRLPADGANNPAVPLTRARKVETRGPVCGAGGTRAVCLCACVRVWRRAAAAAAAAAAAQARACSSAAAAPHMPHGHLPACPHPASAPCARGPRQPPPPQSHPPEHVQGYATFVSVTLVKEWIRFVTLSKQGGQPGGFDHSRLVGESEAARARPRGGGCRRRGRARRARATPGAGQRRPMHAGGSGADRATGAAAGGGFADGARCGSKAAAAPARRAQRRAGDAPPRPGPPRARGGACAAAGRARPALGIDGLWGTRHHAGNTFRRRNRGSGVGRRSVSHVSSFCEARPRRIGGYARARGRAAPPRAGGRAGAGPAAGRARRGPRRRAPGPRRRAIPPMWGGPPQRGLGPGMGDGARQKQKQQRRRRAPGGRAGGAPGARIRRPGAAAGALGSVVLGK